MTMQTKYEAPSPEERKAKFLARCAEFYRKRAIEKPEYDKIARKKYYAQNKEEMNAKAKQYYEEHRNRLKVLNALRYYTKGILETANNSKEYRHFEELQKIVSYLERASAES